MKLKIAVLGMAVMMLAAAQQPVSTDAPSFDCAKARSRVEKTICADAQLSALDKRAGELFALALSHSPDPGDIKKEQRRWLRERDDCEDAACMTKAYEQRIELLETYTGRLPVRLARALCARFETPDTRAETLERRSGIEDSNNDGVPETATACAGGTANVPCVSYVDAHGKPVLIQPQGFEWTTYSPLGRAAFRYEDRTFVYYSHDAALAEPSHLAYVTPTNREFRVCEFETSVGSAVVEGGEDVCAAVETGEGIEPVELANAADRGTAAFGRPDTFAKSIGGADIDNDGLDDDLIELSYESGGGQGCTFNYFELLGEDHLSPVDNSKSIPVRELQGLTAEGYRGRNCGNVENRLFKFGGKTYYETNVTNNRLVPHELRVLDGTATATLCTFERQVTTKIKKLFTD